MSLPLLQCGLYNKNDPTVNLKEVFGGKKKQWKYKPQEYSLWQSNNNNNNKGGPEYGITMCNSDSFIHSKNNYLVTTLCQSLY